MCVCVGNCYCFHVPHTARLSWGTSACILHATFTLTSHTRRAHLSKHSNTVSNQYRYVPPSRKTNQIVQVPVMSLTRLTVRCDGRDVTVSVDSGYTMQDVLAEIAIVSGIPTNDALIVVGGTALPLTTPVTEARLLPGVQLTLVRVSPTEQSNAGVGGPPELAARGIFGFVRDAAAQLWNSLPFGTRIPTVSRTAPRYQWYADGLNAQFVCRWTGCASSGTFVVVRLGFGTVDLQHRIFDAVCPAVRKFPLIHIE